MTMANAFNLAEFRKACFSVNSLTTFDLDPIIDLYSAHGGTQAFGNGVQI